VEKQLSGRAIVPGEAAGEAVMSHQPISFWGGINSLTGEIIDRRHDQSGKIIAGKVFVFPISKGSSTGSAVLMESIKNGVAPAAIILAKVDPILALGSIVAEELYHKSVPIVILSRQDFDTIQDNDRLVIHSNGLVEISL
jgi:predicted aconitase with swiveling domain